MEILRTEHRLKLCYAPLYNLDHSDLKICYLNARSLHKHIEDVRKDTNYSSTDILIFSETRFSPLDADEMYCIDGYRLFRNDISNYSGPTRPYGRTAVYSRIPLIDGYPLTRSMNGVESTVIKTNDCPNLTIIGLCRSPKIAISRLLDALRIIHDENSSSQNLVIVDFNVNWMLESERQSLYNIIQNNRYSENSKHFENCLFNKQ